MDRYNVNGIPRSDEWWQDTLSNLEFRRGLRYATTRLWNPDSHLLGIAGEIALADFYRALHDTRIRPGGDKGVDIEALTRITGKVEWIKHDAKTATFPKELWTGALTATSPTKPDVLYVLCRHVEKLDATVLGWEWGHEMLKCPTRIEGDREVHVKARGLLRPMSELKEAYCERWRWFEDTSSPFDGHPATRPTNAYLDEQGRVIHNKCADCDQAPSFSVGFFPRKGQLGMWYCKEHWPGWAKLPGSSQGV